MNKFDIIKECEEMSMEDLIIIRKNILEIMKSRNKNTLRRLRKYE